MKEADFLLSARKMVVLSPHLDDAVLSVGALLDSVAKRGVAVEVVTLFAGTPQGELSPVAKGFHANCELPLDGSALPVRRAEDEAAMSVLGVSCKHRDFLDAVYRKDTDGSWLCVGERGMFAANPLPEPELHRNLEKDVREIIREFEADLVLTCAGVGGHIDHVATRAATLKAASVMGVDVLLWEDLPYAGNQHECTSYPAAEPHVLVADDESWSRKLKAVACYKSQIRMLWKHENWEHFLTRHAAKQCEYEGELGEVLWSTGEFPGIG